MSGLTIHDALALGFFLLAWGSYHLALDWHPASARSLTRVMYAQRLAWMKVMAARENRIVDAALIGGLQNGTAFFASTALLAIGGAFSAFTAGDTVIKVVEDLPFTLHVTRQTYELKILGLIVIFVYAFFKFAWSYRLFNYCTILIGATPAPRSVDEATMITAIERAARMNAAAAMHFNRGQRGFFFAIGYLGWLIGPYALIATTSAVVLVLFRRQFASEARAAALHEA